MARLAPCAGRLFWSAAAIALSPNVAAAQPAPARGEPGVLVIGTAATATIKRVMTRAGEHVELGQVLVSLDCGPAEAEVRTRKAQLASTDAVLSRTRNGPRAEELAVAEAAVGYSTARAEEALKTYERMQALREGVSVTQARLLETQRDARITAAQLQEARARLALLRAGSREEDISEAAARREAAAAQLAEAEARVGFCTVRAPVAGAIVEIGVTPGQLVSSAVPVPLLTLRADPDH